MTIEQVKRKYKNGQIPSSALSPIDTGQLLIKSARDSYMLMKADAKKDGVTIKLVGPSSAYRKCGQKGDYTKGLSKGVFTQWYAWELYKAGAGNLASNPTTSKGCKSNHGWGLAIDVKGSSAQKWIKKNGEKYGWWWSGGTFSKIENWHFDYDIDRDTFRKNININVLQAGPSKYIMYAVLIGAVISLTVTLIKSIDDK